VRLCGRWDENLKPKRHEISTKPAATFEKVAAGFFAKEAPTLMTFVRDESYAN